MGQYNNALELGTQVLVFLGNSIHSPLFNHAQLLHLHTMILLLNNSDDNLKIEEQREIIFQIFKLLQNLFDSSLSNCILLTKLATQTLDLLYRYVLIS